MADPLPVTSREECELIAKRAMAMLDTPDASVNVSVYSDSVGTLRWARNQPLASGDSTNLMVQLNVRLATGHSGLALTNRIDEASLRTAVQNARDQAAIATVAVPSFPRQAPAYARVQMLSEPALRLDMPARSALARPMALVCRGRSLVSSGFLSVTAHSLFVTNSFGVSAYNASTRCEYSVTVRDAAGSASGWAGHSHDDWTKIDVAAINERAIQKCVDSAHPVAIEPGRYTTILEPEAVGQLMYFVIRAAQRRDAEEGNPPFGQTPSGPSKIGMRMLDARISVTSDPTDPDAQYTPFNWNGTRYRRVPWFEKGVLTSLAYGPQDAEKYGDNEGLEGPLPPAFRMTGGTASIADMIKATSRGVLVTHFTPPVETDGLSLSVTGNTRDGLWLIENGAISKPIKNLRFNDSPLFAFNNVEHLGEPVRVYGSSAEQGACSIVAPPVTVLDFNFTSLSDAV